MDFPFAKIYNDSKVEIRSFKRNLRPKEVALMMVFAHRVIMFTNQQLSVSYPYSKLGADRSVLVSRAKFHLFGCGSSNTHTLLLSVHSLNHFH